MKTNQVMIRPMGMFCVEQRTKDGFFNGAGLLLQWNSIKENPRRRMSEFLESAKVKEFMIALAEDESQRRKSDIAVNQLLIAIKGRNTKYGRTPDKVWLNPVLFIKFAMWINPRFEVQVIRFVYDHMIEFRNDAGDAHKIMCNALSKLRDCGSRNVYQEISSAINWVVFNCNEKMIRNKVGDENVQRELFYTQKMVANLINDNFLRTTEDVKKYLRRKWVEKWRSKSFVDIDK